jgi:hypothetical protein
MKINPEHYGYMKNEIDNYLKSNPGIVNAYETGEFPRSDRVKDLQRRFCFDMSYYAGLTPFVCKVLYQYVNDTHIYTALKRICPKVTRRY